MEQEKILRINELAKKKKEVGLTVRKRVSVRALCACISENSASRRKRRSSVCASSRKTAAIKPLVKKEKKLN